MSCPRCGGEVGAGQEYCLECGLRLPGAGRLGPVPTSGRRLVPVLAALLALAAAGAAAAIAVTWESGEDVRVITATGGSRTIPERPAAPRLAVWPKGRDAWTIVLVSVPKRRGQDEAVARARRGLDRGLRQVGIVDSSRVPSLRPGYWVVWSGVYPGEPEAASVLQRARRVERTANIRRISG